MTLDQLRYFCAAAELQHMGKAALQENISQPSLSIAIKKLETELEVPLFVMDGRGVALTAEGKEFLHYARGILRQVDAAVARMHTFSETLNSEIHVAYTAAVANTFIPGLFHDFIETQRGKSTREILIYSDQMVSHEIAQCLIEGSVDIGIGAKSVIRKELEYIPIIYQPLVVISAQEKEKQVARVAAAGQTDDAVECRYAQALQQGRALLTDDFPLERLAQEPMVIYNKDYVMYRVVERVLNQLKVHPHVSHYAYSEDSIARLVERGFGNAIVAEVGALGNSQIEIHRPGWLTEGRYIYLFYNKTRSHGKAVQQMISFIRKSSLLTEEQIAEAMAEGTLE